MEEIKLKKNNSNNRNKSSGSCNGGKGYPLKTGRGNKAQRRAEEVVDTTIKGMSKDNDKSWYDRFPQLAKDAGSISFGQPLGKPLNLTAYSGVSTIALNNYDKSACGAIIIRWIPAIGISKDKQSPINRAALNIFVTLRSKQKAAHDYDSQDMMMALMALDSLYMIFEIMRRAYGVARGFQTPENYYYTRTILQAMGFNPEDVIKNIAQLRGYANYLRSSLEKYTLPSDLDFARRHAWMCSGLYLDADNTRAQTYIFRPEFVWLYDNTVTTGSQLTPLKLSDNMTVGGIIAIAEQLLAAINGDDDIGYVCGDLYAAYGSNAMTVLQEIADGYTVIPAYSPEVLAQITNIKFVGEYVDGNITQNPSVNEGAILFNPAFSEINKGFGSRVQNLHMSHDTLLNSHGSTDYLDVIEMTRLTPVARQGSVDATTLNYQLDACGSEICTTFSIVENVYNGDMSNIEIHMTNSIAFDLTIDWQGANLWVAPALELVQFDWAWEMEMFTAGTESASLSTISWDVDKVTPVSASDLTMMHTVALNSTFDMPRIQ